MSFRYAVLLIALSLTIAISGQNVLAQESCKVVPLPAHVQEEIDLALGPWLELKAGGISVGSPQGSVAEEYGSLLSASILPKSGPGFRSVSSPLSSAGAGHMISLLERSAADFNSRHPEILIRVGDISKTDGGYFYPPHKSHQNGLDADILFVGAKTWQSVLDPDGQVTSRFHFENNWEYWRSLTEQKIMQNGKIESIVSMILVAPEIKAALCDWANAQNLLALPENREVMRRIRPTVGHDGHFHLRLRCSPYHAECLGNFSPPQNHGC